MTNTTLRECPQPFLDLSLYSDGHGFSNGRICQTFSSGLTCCLPCPITEWVYPENFNTITSVANWMSLASGLGCLFLLLSWACLPAEKTNRHYLSVCLTAATLLCTLGFIIPLIAQPDQCYDAITAHDMHTSLTCGASGSFLILGGWAGVMWAFLRSLSLHLQICWQVVVDRKFMIFSQITGWGVPAIGLALALQFSGFSFRFGPTCHINHQNSLADFFIPLLLFAGLTVIITFITFGYCIKVYLDAMGNHNISTEGSSTLPSSTPSRSITPGLAYRRVRRVIALQWRGIAIVLIIIADVIFFSLVFVFQDNVLQQISTNPKFAATWGLCLYVSKGDKAQCFDEAQTIVVGLATVSAVLFMISLNGLFVLFLLGRWSMLQGWADILGFGHLFGRSAPTEFVSADARYDTRKEKLYPVYSRDTVATSAATASPVFTSPVLPTPPSPTRRQTPDFFGQTARYEAHCQSYSSPRPPSQQNWNSRGPYTYYAQPNSPERMNPLGMNRI